MRAGRHADAIAAGHEVLRRNPGSPLLQLRIGRIFQDAGAIEDAIACHRMVIASLPRNATAHYHLGLCLAARGQFVDAEIELRQALSLRPDNAEIHNGLGMYLLSEARFEEAWNELEWRWQTKNLRDHKRHFDLPTWSGEKLGGNRLLVWLEQGVGDEIFFAGLLPDLAARHVGCVVEADRRLCALIARSFPDIEVVPRSDPPHPATRAPDVTHQIAAGSLCRFFRAAAGGFDCASYLRADETRTGELGDRLPAPAGSSLKVGIAWHSNNPRSGARRSIPLRLWAPILTRPDCTFVTLQYGDNTDEIATTTDELGVLIYETESLDPWEDLDGLAALVGALDLVISVDNSTVHLAGALGVPTWALLSMRHDARWFRERDDSPWYPTVRLIRQDRESDWGPVIETAATWIARGGAP